MGNSGRPRYLRVQAAEQSTLSRIDALIDLKSERNGGFALGFGLFWLVGFIVIQSVVQAYAVPGAMEIAVYILLALTASEIVKLMSQLWYYRVGA